MAEPAEFDLLDLLLPLAAGWRSLLGATLLAGAAGAAGSFLIAPEFTATTTFMPPQQQQSAAASALSSLGAVAGLAAGAAGLKSPADQYISLMQSATVGDRMIEQFKLMAVYDLKYRDSARKELARRSQMSVGKKDGLITIDVEDTDPARAAAMANQYVEELRRLTGSLAVTEAQQRRVFFERQLQESKQRLTAAQQALQDSGFNPGAIKAEPKAAAESYAGLKAELTSAEVKLQILRHGMAEGSPEVQQQATRVAALREQVRALERAGEPRNGAPDYVGRYREFKYQETLFDLLSRQYELARVDESREGALIQVIDAARPPERKSRPQRAMLAVMCALAGGVAFGLWLIVRARVRLGGPGGTRSLSQRLDDFRAAMQQGR